MDGTAKIYFNLQFNQLLTFRDSTVYEAMRCKCNWNIKIKQKMFFHKSTENVHNIRNIHVKNREYLST